MSILIPTKIIEDQNYSKSKQKDITSNVIFLCHLCTKYNEIERYFFVFKKKDSDYWCLSSNANYENNKSDENKMNNNMLMALQSDSYNMFDLDESDIDKKNLFVVKHINVFRCLFTIIKVYQLKFFI